MPEEPADPDPEHQVIATLTAGQRLPVAVVGPGDDAAILGDGRLLAVDAMVEGVHWDERSTPRQVGRKLFAVNASDIAACGGRVEWALLTLCLPQPLDQDWVKGFSAGLREALGPVPLLGGDTTRSPGPRMASLTLGGRLVGPPLLRSGAGPGQDLWVSGRLGAAADAFHGEGPLQPLVDPAPPLGLGPLLAERGLATAAMDLSDGLAADLPRLCRASGVGARVDTLPTSSTLERALGFGDDYELLFTALPRHRAEILSLPFDLTRIGATDSEPVIVLPAHATGWRHFS